MLKKRADCNDANAMRNLADLYHGGSMGLPQDFNKAMVLHLRAGELGCATSYGKVAAAYYYGRGVERDEKKAKHYYELAAMRGDAKARHNLGCTEGRAGYMDRAMKHLMISAGAGYDDSLKNIRECFMNGYGTKNDFEKALRSHKEAKDEMKSEQRDAAAAALAAIAAAHG